MALRIKGLGLAIEQRRGIDCLFMREPHRRPAGSPNRPFSSGRAAVSAVLVKAHQASAPRPSNRAAYRRSTSLVVCSANGAILWMAGLQPRSPSPLPGGRSGRSGRERSGGM